MLKEESLEDSCLSPIVEAGDLAVEYCLVERERRLFIGVDARQSGRCGRWPSYMLLDISHDCAQILPRTVVTTLDAAMLSTG